MKMAGRLNFGSMRPFVSSMPDKRIHACLCSAVDACTHGIKPCRCRPAIFI
jgi:hypothetical protein